MLLESLSLGLRVLRGMSERAPARPGSSPQVLWRGVSERLLLPELLRVVCVEWDELRDGMVVLLSGQWTAAPCGRPTATLALPRSMRVGVPCECA